MTYNKVLTKDEFRDKITSVMGRVAVVHRELIDMLREIKKTEKCLDEIRTSYDLVSDKPDRKGNQEE